MSTADDIEFDFIDDIAVFRLIGEQSMGPGVQLLRKAIAQAHVRGISRLMIVITESTGYDVPSLAMRLAMMREWADAAGGFVRASIVCRPEFIDPHKFGVVMAANFGMVANVFDSEGEAIDWLRHLG